MKQDIEKLKALLSLVRKCCSVAIKIKSTIFPLQWHFKREANGVSNSPCQIQLLALRDARALDPHGRGMRGMRAVHFWRACVSVAWRRATRTQGRWTGPRSRLLSLGLARPGRRAWLWLSATRASVLATRTIGPACRPWQTARLCARTAAGRSDDVRTLRI